MIYKEENGQIVVRLNCQEEISDVINALDLYSRIWIGQLLEIDNQMIWLKEKLYETDSAAKMTPFFLNIRNHILPGALTNIGNTLHSSYGIFSKKIDRRARIAYDMQQVIRYTSAWYFHPDGGHSVDFGTPMQAEETVKMPAANCIAHEYETGMEIHLTCLSQLEVFKEAIAVLGCLYGGKICDLFAHYTKDADALTVARHIEQYYSGLKDKDELPKISDSLIAEA